MPKRAKSPASPTRPTGVASVASQRDVLGNQSVVQLVTKLSASVFVIHAVVLLLGPSSPAWALAFKAAPAAHEADAYTYRSYAAMALFCAAVVATVPTTHERAVQMNKLLFGLASAAALLAVFVHPHATTTLLKVGTTILWTGHFACGFGLVK